MGESRPQSKLVFSLDMQLLKALEKSDEQDIKNLQKKIDSKPSSSQNKPMTNTTFALAVLTAIGQLRQQGAFSAHDVTKSVRNTLNQGDVNLIDRQREQFNNGDNYRVEHGEVKEIFAILLENQIVTGLDRRFNGVYFEYSNQTTPTVTSYSTPAQIAAQLFAPPAAQSALQKTVQLARQIISPTPTLAQLAQAQPVSVNSDLVDKLKSYLNGRLNETVTMKRIQSRFDTERNRTCGDYATIIMNQLGVRVNKPVAHPSKWYVNLSDAI